MRVCTLPPKCDTYGEEKLFEVLLENLKMWDRLENLRVGGRIILKWIKNMLRLTLFTWLRIGTVAGLL